MSGLESDTIGGYYNKIRALVARQKQEYGWEFLFLGANIES